jgi:tetratricopeptide (TPR) repeat protein
MSSLPSISSSRVTYALCCLACLTVWAVIACTAADPVPVTPARERGAILYTRTPVPTVTPTPTVLPEVIFQQGLAKRDAWDLEAALDQFALALDLAPSAPVYASRAEVYRLTGHYDQAAADIERALTLDPKSTEAWRQKALLSRAKTEWDEALAAADKLIELDPQDGASYVVRAQIHVEGFGNTQLALADYDRAIAQDPVFDKATLVERWHMLAESEQWLDALLVSYKMSIFGSEDPARFFFRGWSLIQVGRLDDAIRTLLSGLELYPDYPVAYYYALGVAYLHRTAWLEAIQALEVALIQLGTPPNESDVARRLSITNSDILARMGLAYLELQQCETGAAMVERAVAESPDPETWARAVERIDSCYISLTPTPTPEETPTP